MIRDITIGRYIERSSPMHRADARTKIIAASVFAVMVFVFGSPVSVCILAALCAAATAISKIPPLYVFKGLKSLRWFILFTIAVNLFAVHGKILWQWHIIRITDEGAIAAALGASRLVLLVWGTSLLTLTTPPIALTDGIARLMKPLRYIRIPTEDIAVMISITLRFIPIFADEADKIMKAQRSRGADLGGKKLKVRAVIPIAVPLFVSAMRRSTELALAMDTRCYGRGTRNPRKKTKMGVEDAIILTGMSFILIFLLIFKIFH